MLFLPRKAIATIVKLISCRLPYLICLLLLLPLLFASPESTAPLHIGLPRVFSGDEPHYLIAINSLILDGDIDLSKDYAAVHKGSTRAGARWAGSPLDGHTVWFENGLLTEWPTIFETSPANWDHDGEGHPVPRLRTGQASPSEGHPEYPKHPLGLAILLAPLLFAFRHTRFVEPLAICCSTGAVIAAMFVFRALLRKYSPDRRAVDLVAAVTFLGTPAWFYGRTLFTEPYLLLFAIGSYTAVLRANRPFLAGTFVGLGMLMKPPFALLLIPLFALYVGEHRLKSAALLSLPGIASLAFILCLNDIMFGSPWTPSIPWIPGSVWVGVAQTLFSPTYGYLIIAPAIVVALAAWPSFFRSYPRDAAVLASGIGLYFVFFSSFETWSGASSYAARYEVPILPLLFVSLIKLPEMRLWQAARARYAVIAICSLSIAVNGIAAMPYWKYWDTNPLYEAVHWALPVGMHRGSSG